MKLNLCLINENGERFIVNDKVKLVYNEKGNSFNSLFIGRIFSITDKEISIYNKVNDDCRTFNIETEVVNIHFI